MSDSWIRIRGSLSSHPKFLTICERLWRSIDDAKYLMRGSAFESIFDEDTILTLLDDSNWDFKWRLLRKGAFNRFVEIGLYKVWLAVNEYAEMDGDDAVCCPLSIDALDEIAQIPGLGRAMVEVGWLRVGGDQTLVFVRFSEHNKVRKDRSDGAERTRRWRARARASALVHDHTSGTSALVHDHTSTDGEFTSALVHDHATSTFGDENFVTSTDDSTSEYKKKQCDKKCDKCDVTRDVTTSHSPLISSSSSSSSSSVKSNSSKSKARAKKKEKEEIPPRMDDVVEYCRERGGKIDPEAFMDYYQAQGWQLSNGRSMKDWRAAIRNWERRDAKPAVPDKREAGRRIREELERQEAASLSRSLAQIDRADNQATSAALRAQGILCDLKGVDDDN